MLCAGHLSPVCRLALFGRGFTKGYVVATLGNQFSSTCGNRRSKIFTIPNLITASRITLTPFIINSVLCNDLSTALGLTVVAGITDMLDGLIARNVPNQASSVGSILDPLADKILVTSLVLSLTLVDMFPIHLACLFVFRDAGIVTVVSLLMIKNTYSMSSQVIEMKASSISKLNTFCQLSSIILSMTYSLYGFPNYKYLNAVWLLSAGTTITSGLGYLRSLPEWRKRIIQKCKK
ncbi:putative cardiolipin synthase [Schistosoma japonicum]|nr:putative cardiolipin synthase [Schistosoma japonicum]